MKPEQSARYEQEPAPVTPGGAVRLTEAGWRDQWDAARMFLTADGEADKRWGNETIRFNPDEGWLELKLPAPLSHLANRPSGRYRLSCPVAFSHRGDEVAAQAATAAIRYDIALDPASGRWYLDASWRTCPQPAPSLGDLRQAPVVAVDVNAGHLAAAVVARPPAGAPPPGFRSSRCGSGDRQACARPPGAAKGRRDRRWPADQRPESCPPSTRGRAHYQERRAPPGSAAATPVAQDRDGHTATPAPPGSPRPFGAAH